LVDETSMVCRSFCLKKDLGPLEEEMDEMDEVDEVEEVVEVDKASSVELSQACGVRYWLIACCSVASALGRTSSLLEATR
jgi:hypothetical protein